VLEARSWSVLNKIIEIYLDSGQPVGSRTLSKAINSTWSPATLRNIMADLESENYLYAPHRSAGRVPTSKALRIYIQHLGTQKNNLPAPLYERLHQIFEHHGDIHTLLSDLSQGLADLSGCASIIVIPPQEPLIQSIDFLMINPSQALCILVTCCGQVQHRLINTTHELNIQMLKEASNYLNARIKKASFSEARNYLKSTISCQQKYLHQLSLELIEKGLNFSYNKGEILVKGQHKMLKNIDDMEMLQSFKALFSWLETQEKFQTLFDQVCHSGHVQIFLGDEEGLFDLEGYSFVIAPFSQKTFKAGIGLVGFAQMDYRTIIPLIENSIKFIERI
jgi:heat-inducible transcriptional repressor